MKISIDELCPGEEVIWRLRVDQKKNKLENGDSLPPISVAMINGRKHHRVRAFIEYAEQNDLPLPLEIDCVIYSGETHELYPQVCERLFNDYGKGIKAFKAIPFAQEL